MKKLISALLAIILIISAVVSLSSCEILERMRPSTTNPGGYNGVITENMGYYSVKTLFSYDDVMNALSIVRQRQEVKPTYTVKDMGEDYTIFYRFHVDNLWTAYPIDYDTYFNTKSDGYFETYIFFENQECSSEKHYPNHTNYYFSYEEDEDYDKITKYRQENACIRIEVQRDERYVEITRKELLGYYELDGFSKLHFYQVNYDGSDIISLVSCVELDDAFFDLFFDNLVTTSAKK